MEPLSGHLPLARRLAQEFSGFAQVKAVGLGGSLAAGSGQSSSDIDLYVFVTAPIPLAERSALALAHHAARANIGLDYWDPGDEWFDGDTGIEVDLIYWDPEWIREQVERPALQNAASVGYSTCFWHTIRSLVVLFDRGGWLADLKNTADLPYPEELRRNIILKNYPLLGAIIPAFSHQLEKAVQRQDWVSVNHRLAAYLASYFDILFAFNYVLHPGEKRLITLAQEKCRLLPAYMAEHLHSLLVPNSAPDQDWLAVLAALNHEIEILLLSEGFLF